jgi:hypothetical protein
MSSAIVIMGMREKYRGDFSLITPGRLATDSVGRFNGLVRLLDYSKQSQKPLLIVTHGFKDHLSEIQYHPSFTTAKIVYSAHLDATNNPEFDGYLRSLGAHELIVAGFNFAVNLADTVEGAARKGYSLHSAKSVLFAPDGALITPEVYEGVTKHITMHSLDELLKVA